MNKMIANQYKSVIPTQVDEKTFNEFFLPHLSISKRGPKMKIGMLKMFNYILRVLYTGMQWKSLECDKNSNGQAEIHYTSVYKKFAKWASDGSLVKAFDFSVISLAKNNMLDTTILNGDGTSTIAKKGGDGIGYSGHKHFKGDKVVAITDNHGHILTPYTIAAGNKHEGPLLANCIKHLFVISKKAGINLDKSYLNLDSSYDSKKNRKLIFNKNIIPNIEENKRNRKEVKRGRKRLFNQGIYDFRLHVIERTFAWEDKFKRLLMRFERIQQRHLGFKLLAYSLINIRFFCS